MARITVEDCIDKFPSRFELVLVASNRARKLHSGETPKLEKDNDKNTVIALREIAEESISANDLKNDLIEEYQTVNILEDDLASEEKIDENNDENEYLTDENNIDTKEEIDHKEDNSSENEKSSDNLELNEDNPTNLQENE
tara:strand:- start:63 stop:485 length:423 start_codon:yes stop_codon:yes gene_type:complete